jgi:four helix bundle protein
MQNNEQVKAGRRKVAILEDKSNYRKLDVWHKAFNLVITTFKISKQFPKSEQFGLTSQIHRSALSVPSNIAEGYMRNHKAEYARFISIALGSLAELQTQLLLSKELFQVGVDLVDFALAESEHLMAMLIKLLKAITKSREAERSPLPITHSPNKVDANGSI